MCRDRRGGPLSHSRPASRELAERMAAALQHRGPDSARLARLPGDRPGVRRLAIIDLAGRPPAHRQRGRLRRGRLQRRDLQPRGAARGLEATGPPLPHALRHRGHPPPLRGVGRDCVHGSAGCSPSRSGTPARGDFSSPATGSGSSRSTTPTRPTGFAFASEQKAILAAGVPPGPLDVRALDELFLFGFILVPGTLFRGIRRLPLVLPALDEGGRTVVRPYWRLAEVLSRRPCHEQSLLLGRGSSLCAKLAETVALHARADVRIGAWLSGGLDSSAVAALARRTRRTASSFTIGFQTPAYDERAASACWPRSPEYELPNERVVCGVAGFRRYPEVRVAGGDALGLYPGPAALLAGRDLGPPRQGGAHRGEGQQRCSGVILALCRSAPPSRSTLPLSFRKRLLQGGWSGTRWPVGSPAAAGAPAMDLSRYARTWRARSAGRLAARCFPPISGASSCLLGRDAEEPARTCPPPVIASPGSDTTILRTRSAGYMTESVDRTTMAFGLEARVPFLDHEWSLTVAVEDPRWTLPASRPRERQHPPPSDGPGSAGRHRLAAEAPRRGASRSGCAGGCRISPRAWWSPDRLRADGYFDAAAVQALVARHRGVDPRLPRPPSVGGAGCPARA